MSPTFDFSEVPSIVDCHICSDAWEEMNAAYGISFQGEMAQDAQMSDIELFEGIIEDHPNHEVTIKDSLMSRSGFFASGPVDD